MAIHCCKALSSASIRVMEVWLNMYRLALFALVTTPLFAQTAELSGIVSDPSGLPVPNATINLQNQATGATRRFATPDIAKTEWNRPIVVGAGMPEHLGFQATADASTFRHSSWL